MAKQRKLGVIEKFYIENHPSEAPEALAKTVGCSVRQVNTFLRSVRGLNREGNPKGTPEALLSAPAPEPAKSPVVRLDALLSKKSDRGVVSMTKEASEVGDDIAAGKIGPSIVNPLQDSERVHTIDPTKPVR